MPIKEVEVDGERIYLKKSFLGWGVVHPISQDGKVNWKNLISGGSWLKLFGIAIIVGIIIGCIAEYSAILQTANECLNMTKVVSPAWP